MEAHPDETARINNGSQLNSGPREIQRNSVTKSLTRGSKRSETNKSNMSQSINFMNNKN
jgi:hypothetical protein